MSFLVLKDLKEEIKQGLSEWELEQSSGDSITPNIYIGNLPPKKSSSQLANSNDANNRYPFILIRAISSNLTLEDALRSKVFNVAVIVGIYSKESTRDDATSNENGNEILLNTVDKVIEEVIKKRFYGGTFYVDNDVDWSYGLGKTIDPYECGIQTDGPYFAAVINFMFNEETSYTTVDTNNLV